MNSSFKISLIAAIGENRELGKDNKLLWHIPEDFKRFKTLTTGHPVIMGRKTYESLNRPDGLPNRLNIVISRTPQTDTETVKWVVSLDEAIEKAQDVILIRKLAEKDLKDSSAVLQNDKIDEVFVIGGGQIFQEAIKIADKLYLTIIHKSFDADTFFPEYSKFTKEVFREDGTSGDLAYTFLDLERE